jgi:cyclic beta-1,2-glucan synthetase
MKDFIPLCQQMEDHQQIERLENKIREYESAIEEHAWDGKWYLRAFYDDGTPLGSSQNNECKIDSLSQSWAVLSDSADEDRAKQAMQSVWTHLYKPDEKLLLLFTPPFNKTDKDPGYIKGYPPGVRENGGQYTHAAIWTVWAFAHMGQGDQAESLFQLLNPILHSDNEVDAQQYRVEPYVVAADVYSVKPYVGMGGWTWYTGSSGWMYRLGVEAILGIERQGNKLKIDPCIPSSWESSQIKYHFEEATYIIQIENPEGLNRGIVEFIIDGEHQSDFYISLSPEKSVHHVKVSLGKS